MTTLEETQVGLPCPAGCGGMMVLDSLEDVSDAGDGSVVEIIYCCDICGQVLSEIV